MLSTVCTTSRLKFLHNIIFSYANALHFRDNLHNNWKASFISHKSCHLSARKTRTPRRTQISMTTGNALQKPKIYQNWSQSHSSITNIDREIAALEWATMESILAVPLNIEQPPMNPANSTPRNTRVKDNPTINLKNKFHFNQCYLYFILFIWLIIGRNQFNLLLGRWSDTFLLRKLKLVIRFPWIHTPYLWLKIHHLCTELANKP